MFIVAELIKRLLSYSFGKKTYVEKEEFTILYKCSHCFRQEQYHGAVQCTVRSVEELHGSAVFGDGGSGKPFRALDIVLDDLYKLRTDINEKHKYSRLADHCYKIKCPDCGAVQPWGDIPDEPFDPPLSVCLLLMLALFLIVSEPVCSLMDKRGISGGALYDIVLFFPVLLMIYIKISAKMRTRSNRKKIEALDEIDTGFGFDAPEFIDYTNRKNLNKT